jgi:hypothetical protein
MNYTRTLALSFLILSAFILGCKKDHSPAPAPVPVKLDSLHINLIPPTKLNGLATDPYNNYELIISEAGGKVLMDTITPYNTPIITWLKTNQKLLDITMVRKWATTGSYLIHSYKAIDLTAWQNIPENDSVQLPTGGTPLPPPVLGITTYTNVNVPMGSYYNVLNSDGADAGQAWNRIMYSRYNTFPGDYAYLIFPTLGLYNIHIITGAGDMVDLSNPDTAVWVPFNKPAAYSTSGFNIAGYPDPADLSHLVNLTYFSANGYSITDATGIFYPGKKYFKKYSFSYYVSDGTNNNSSSVSLPYVDTIPDNPPVPDPSWYTISLNQDTTVSVDFKTHKPTYYDVTSHVGDIQFRLTAPGDSTMLRPVDFYIALKSKLLGNQDLSMMKMDQISIVTDAEPNYQTYWSKRTGIYQVWKEPASANSTFQSHF